MSVVKKRGIKRLWQIYIFTLKVNDNDMKVRISGQIASNGELVD